MRTKKLSIVVNTKASKLFITLQV